MKNLKIFVYIWIIFFVSIVLSCKENNSRKEIAKIVQHWQNKEVVFPAGMIFTNYGTDTIAYKIPSSSYKILMYVDSIGCTSCKLQLHKWKEFISELDSFTNGSVPVIFFFHPKDMREISYLLKRDGINIPVCIDMSDKLNAINNFPSQQEFQTFLLNNENKVIYIGNPVHNPRVKEMYLSGVSNSSYNASTIQSSKNAQIKADKTEFDLETIQKGSAKTISVPIKNIGESPFVIFDTQASCGCTHISYEKKPIMPDSTTVLKIKYNADDMGHFNKTVSVYGNMKDSLLVIRLKGNIE
jgi:hypothetical protein